MRKLRYGILGSGFMGRTHAEAIRQIENAELVAIALGSRAPGESILDTPGDSGGFEGYRTH